MSNQNYHIMHLRSLDNGNNPNNKFDPSKRGITVYAEIDQDSQGNDTVTFGWSVQNPKDQFNKKRGTAIAYDRFLNENNEFITVQSDYFIDYPLKYQFFNAVALAREYVKNYPSKFSSKDMDFIDLTFGTLCQIAYDNHWYYNVNSSMIPKVHPDIMINFVHRLQINLMKKNSFKQKYIDPLYVSFVEKVNTYGV